MFNVRPEAEQEQARTPIRINRNCYQDTRELQFR